MAGSLKLVYGKGSYGSRIIGPVKMRHVDDQNKVYIGKLTPTIEGSTNGSWDWPNWWYAWGMNHAYSGDGIVIFTPEYKDSVTPQGRTCVVVRNGTVTSIDDSQAAIPSNGYVIWYGVNKVFNQGAEKFRGGVLE